MKLIIDKYGEIINLIFKSDLYKFNDKFFDVETLDDPFISDSILKFFMKKDINNKGKFYVKNNELFERTNWKSFKKENILHE